MANKRQRKKAAQKAASYEGQQYRGGRAKGRKNLKKTETGNLVNEHGVVFTPEEKRALENAVNTANRKRARMLKEAATLPRMVAGRDTGDTVASLQLMGKESDFILAKKTKSLQRFRDREQFEKYMDTLKRVNSRDYLDQRIREYKSNYLKGFKEMFGQEGMDVYMKLRMMKPRDYMKTVEMTDGDLEFGYMYGPDEKTAKLNTIRAALGMKMKEEPFDDGEYYD